MTTTVLIEVRNVYGNELYYPANETADVMLRLTGKKTFSKVDFNNIKALGFTVEVSTPKVEL